MRLDGVSWEDFDFGKRELKIRYGYTEGPATFGMKPEPTEEDYAPSVKDMLASISGGRASQRSADRSLKRKMFIEADAA